MSVRNEYSLAPPFIETRPENRRWSGHTCDHRLRRAYPLLRDRLARPLTSDPFLPSDLSTLNYRLLRSSAFASNHESLITARLLPVRRRTNSPWRAFALL